MNGKPTVKEKSRPYSARAVLAALLVAGATTLWGALPVAVSTEVGTGFWMNDFAAATNLAHATSTPMVLFWANQGCTFCGYLEEAVNTSTFKAWQAAHADNIYCYVQGVNSKDVAPNAGANVIKFARSAAGTLPASKYLSQYPFICLYWPQPTGKPKVTSFVGRTGKMLVPATGRTLEQELEDSISKFFSGYSPSIELGFRCGDVAGTLGLENRTDRLEAEPATQYVDVPLFRRGSVAGQSRSTLVVKWPDGIRPVTSNIVNWAALETNAYVSVDLTLPGGASFPEGGRLELTLLDASGQIVATNGITFVALKPNACTNPYWVGERTVDTLGFAEWTHDYDLVRAKVAAGKADYTLAVFSGTLWCPYCHGMEESLLKSDAFKAWCAANRVQVALFDQSQTAANGGGSQLLTYAPGTEHIANTDTVTGASYLSRHSLRDDDPDAVRIRAAPARYSQTDWLAPESTSARLSNPTVLLIGPDDKVVGRFRAWRDRNRTFGHELGDKYYDPEENLARLDDLLKLAARGDERQDYASTTTNVLDLGGTVVSTLQVNDVTDHYLLKPTSRGKAVFSVADKTADRTIRLALVRDGVEVASSTDGDLSVEIARADLAAKRLVLRVSAPELSGASVRVGPDTAFDATIISAFEPITQDSAVVYAAFAATTPLSSYVVAKGQKVTIKVTSGKLPKGVSLKWDAATSSVVLKGTPTKTGTYSFTYQVVVKTAKGKTVSSEKTKATVTVASAASINPHYGKAIVASVPLYKTDTWGVKTVASVVQVAQTTAKKLSVKRFAGATTSFSGTWKKVDPESGTLTASLKKGSVTVALTLTPEGLLTASIAGNAGTVSVVNDYARFAGRYTVTLPVAETTARYYTFGTGYLTLKTSTLTSLKGLVTYAGALPNGVAVSGSAYLGSDPEDPDYVFLPIFKQSSRTLVSSSNGKKKYATKDDLAAVLRIRANGEAYYTDDEQNRIVLAPEGVSATWKRTTSAPGNALVATLAVYGGYYVPGGTLDGWLALFGLGTESDLVATVDGLDVQAIWKFSPETGVLTGTAKTVVNRRTVTASFKGVILPGWLDCGCGDDLIARPFASGTFYWSEFVNGITTPASLEFNLNAP